MHLQLKNIALAAAVALLGTTAANASIIGVGDANGSEWLLSVVNTTTNSSVTQDLGIQNNTAATANYALTSDVATFITNAGGLANISFAVISGNGSTFDFVTTSAKANFATLSFANSTKTNWSGSINSLINTLDATDLTATSVNNSYGGTTGFSGPTPAYIGGNHYRWGIATANTVNTGPALDGVGGANALGLYLVNFDQNATLGTGVVSSLGTATLTGSNLSLNLATVPVPAAAWLFGSALGLLGISRRRQAAV